MTFDCEARVTWANESALEIYGKQSVDTTLPLTGRIAKLGLCLPDGSPLAPQDAPVSRSLRGETVGKSVVGLPAEEKEIVWFSVSSIPLKDEKGALTGAALTFRDITKYRPADERLRNSEEKLRGLIQHAPTGIYEIALDGPRFQSLRSSQGREPGPLR